MHGRGGDPRFCMPSFVASVSEVSNPSSIHETRPSTENACRICSVWCQLSQWRRVHVHADMSGQQSFFRKIKNNVVTLTCSEVANGGLFITLKRAISSHVCSVMLVLIHFRLCHVSFVSCFRVFPRCYFGYPRVIMHVSVHTYSCGRFGRRWPPTVLSQLNYMACVVYPRRVLAVVAALPRAPLAPLAPCPPRCPIHTCSAPRHHAQAPTLPWLP